MTPDFLQQNWALLAASLIGLAVALLLLHRAWQDSVRGRLRAAVASLAKSKREVLKLERVLEKAQRTLARLESRSDAVAPRAIEEAREAVTDGKALLKIRSDQVLVQQTRVRTIIFEEFPPRRHESMRRRHLDD